MILKCSNNKTTHTHARAHIKKHTRIKKNHAKKTHTNETTHTHPYIKKHTDTHTHTQTASLLEAGGRPGRAWPSIVCCVYIKRRSSLPLWALHFHRPLWCSSSRLPHPPHPEAIVSQHAHTYALAHTYTNARTYTHTYTRTHTHKHAHTHTPSPSFMACEGRESE